MNKKIFFVFGFLLVFTSLNIHCAYAYNATTTHNLITIDAIKSLRVDLNSDDYAQILSGNIREDDGIRPRNHSYDPVNNSHWFTGPSIMTAKDWGKQSVFNSYDWSDNLFYYVSGKRTEAMNGLGRVVHLIQDMAVPDHTRLDKHVTVGGVGDVSPYENYTDRFTATNTDILAQSPGIEPVDLPTLGDYFDQLATYSNNNFYSKDSIESLNYSIINPVLKNETLSDGKVHTFAWTWGDNGYRLYELATTTCKAKTKVCKFSKTLTELVVADYWKQLSPKAVGYSAGVINLFFKEAERAKADYNTHQESKSWFKRLVERIKLNIAAAKTLTNQEISRLTKVGDLAGADERRRLLAGLNALATSTASTSRAVSRVEQQIEDGRLSMWDYLKLGLADGQQLINMIRSFAAEHQSLAAILLNFNVDDLSGLPTAPVILSPTAIRLSQVFSTTTIIFSGAADPGTAIYTDLSPDVMASTSATGTWKLSLSDIPAGTSTLHFYARNDYGESSSTDVTIFVKAPKVVRATVPELKIGSCDSRFTIGVSGCLLPEKNNYTFAWAAIRSADLYILHASSTYFDFGSVSKSRREYTFTPDQKSFTFNIGEKMVTDYWLEAKLSSGASATSSVVRLISFRGAPVVISEVATNISTSSLADAYVELENTTGLPIDLSGHNLSLAGGVAVALSGIVPARGFALFSNSPEAVRFFKEIDNEPLVQVTNFSLSSLAGKYGLTNGHELWQEVVVAPSMKCDISSSHPSCLSSAETYATNAAQQVDGLWYQYPYQDYLAEEDYYTHSVLPPFPMSAVNRDGRLIMGTPGRENVYGPRPM